MMNLRDRLIEKRGKKMRKTIFLLAKEGEEKSFSQLYRKYQPVVFKMQKTYYLRELDQDDWYQEGQIIFHQSLQKYNESKGLSFGYFFKMNLERHVVSLLRKQGALKRKAALLSVSFEGELEAKGDFFSAGIKGDDTSFSQMVIIKEQLDGFCECLSTFERRVFLSYLEGREANEISDQLACSIGKVKNAMERVKRKFKDAIK